MGAPQDKLNLDAALKKLTGSKGEIRLGRIVEVYAGSYTCLVNTGTSERRASWELNNLDTPLVNSLALLFVPYVGQCRVISTVAPATPAHAAFFRALWGSGIELRGELQHYAPLRDSKAVVMHHAGRPLDVLPGDKGWINDDGGIIGLFRGCVAIVKASELSQIQCLSVDDLVRVISRNYEHFSDFGEFRVSNDEGRLTIEMLGASKEIESKGTKEYKDILQDSEKVPAIGSLRSESLYSGGRWRLKFHLGYMGDQIHMWVTKPPDQEMLKDTKDTVDEAASKESGVAEIFVGSDGAVKVRSVREIISQKVGKLPTPHKVKAPWERTITPVDSGLTQFQEEATHPSGKHLTKDEREAYQNGRYDVKKYREHSEEFKIKDEVSVTAPVAETGENAFEPDAGSTVMQRSDGSIYFEARPKKPDGWEAEWPDMGHAPTKICSSVELTADGDVKIAATRDILLEAGRDIIQMGGSDIIARAKRHVDITASEEDVRLKGGHSIQGYAGSKRRNGGILFETESSSLGFEPTSDTGEDHTIRGIILKVAGNAPIYMSTGGGVGIWSGDFLLDASQMYCRSSLTLAGNLNTNSIEATDVTANSFSEGAISPTEINWPLEGYPYLYNILMNLLQFSFRPTAQYRWLSKYYQTKPQFLSGWSADWSLDLVDLVNGTIPWPGPGSLDSLRFRYNSVNPPIQNEPYGTFVSGSLYQVRS